MTRSVCAPAARINPRRGVTSRFLSVAYNNNDDGTRGANIHPENRQDSKHKHAMRQPDTADIAGS